MLIIAGIANFAIRFPTGAEPSGLVVVVVFFDEFKVNSSFFLVVAAAVV